MIIQIIQIILIEIHHVLFFINFYNKKLKNNFTNKTNNSNFNNDIINNNIKITKNNNNLVNEIKPYTTLTNDELYSNKLKLINKKNKSKSKY